MISGDSVAKTPRLFALMHPISAASLLVAVLQGALFVLHAPITTYAVAVLILSIAQFLLALGWMFAKRRPLFLLLLVLYVAQASVFVVSIAPQGPFRLLQVAIILAYFAPVVTGLLLLIPIVRPAFAVWVSCLLAVGVFAAEILLSSSQTPQRNRGPVISTLIRDMSPDPRVGAINAPGSVLTVYYRGNPQGSFLETDPRESQWWLRAEGGSVARLRFPSDSQDVERVEIIRAATSMPYDIQLNHPNYRAKANSKYAVSFRARSDQPRQFLVGFARAHSPWSSLGLYVRVSLTTRWQSFEINFTTLQDANDDNARVFFDLGENGSSVEVSAVRLIGLPDGATIDPATPAGNYAIEYRFNSIGCRGPDYARPKPRGTERLLMLGNAYVLGSGIRDEATVSYQLANLLSAKPSTAPPAERYEVINCGTDGYGSREERLFYERSAKEYQPDTVIIGVTPTDDMSFWEMKDKGYILRRPGTLEYLFNTWKALQDYMHRRPQRSFARCVQEIRQLDADVRRNGGRLVVLIFRNNIDFGGSTESGRLWNLLTKTVTDGLQGTEIPILDLGQALAERDLRDDVKIHAEVGIAPNESAHAIAAQQLLGFLQHAKTRQP